ncbi:MAG: hypothetical protein K2Q22_05480, partial [Cytophagales bacterium]|nr:hypothetical protein [Cytophagales bacterium]
MKKSILALSISLILFSNLYAQEIPSNLDKSTLEKAVKVYKQILSKDQNTTVTLELAEALYLLGKNDESAQYYSKVINNEGVLPIHYKIFSNVLQNLGKSDSASIFELKYKKVELEAALLTKDLQLLTGFSHDTISFFVNKVPFNSSDADFSPVMLDTSMIFVSTRKRDGDINIHQETGEPLYDLYKVNFRPEGEFTKPEKLSWQNIDHDVAEGP